MHRTALRLAFLLVVPFLLLTAPQAAHAQRIDSTQVARFQLAESYLRAGQFERAITLLEDLYAVSPETHVFYDKLKEAYENVKRYDEAIQLVDAQVERSLAAPVLLAEKGRLLYLKGDETAALAAWDEALRAMPEAPNTYLSVYRSLLQVRLFERAIAVLEQGRTALDAPELFQTDLAYLFSITGDHERAMAEYLGLLAQNERQLNFVRNRLSRFIEQEEALLASIAMTERGVRREPLNRAYRELLGWLYLEAGMYREAFDTNRAIDRLEQEQGQVLFAFAQQAGDAGAYDVALEAYGEILARHADSPAAPEAQRGLARMHERWAEKIGERAHDDQGTPQEAPHYAQALATYRAFLQTYPSHPYYPDVLRSIGRLQQDVFYALDEAEATLRAVTERYPNTPAADEAEYDLGRIAVLRGKPDEARVIFRRLEQRLRTGELAERARYESALIHFYQGEFDGALTLAEAMKENTSTDMANDAIELKVLLVENRGPDSLNTPLRQYAAARLQLRQRQTGEALQSLETLLNQYGQHPLADDVRFLRAQVLREMGRAAEAHTAYREIPLMHPMSYLADQALFAAAEILADALGDPKGAIALYTQLLNDYPGSLLIPEVRARIRLLRDADA